MRTYVRTTARPWNPRIELDGALQRGDLSYAITLAAEVSEDSRRPLDLATALRFLPLIARESPREFDAWALRWLSRWASETPATIDQAAEVAAALADLPGEPGALEMIRRTVGCSVGAYQPGRSRDTGRSKRDAELISNVRRALDAYKRRDLDAA